MGAASRNTPVFELRVALTTADYERMFRFYHEGLGLDPAELWTTEQSKAAIFEMGRGTLEIFDEAHAAEVDQIEAGDRVSGQIRFALEVPDLEQAMNRLLAKGATLVHEPIVTPWGHHNVRLRDPDGLQVTLFQVLGEDRKE
jgi:catechol 2,3-dioxygenase-like lactoylglutathione lyase family enzyme